MILNEVLRLYPPAGLLTRLVQNKTKLENLTLLAGVMLRSHIDWREEPAVARTLAPKGVDCEISYQLERRTSANKDAGSQRGLIVRSHIN